MNIRTAIFGTYVIASAVGLAVLMRFVLAEVRPRYVSSIERTMQDSAHLIAATLSEHRAPDLDSQFKAWAEAKSGLRLRLKDATGEVIFDSRPGDLLAARSELDSRNYKSTKNRISWMIDRQPFLVEGELVVTAPWGKNEEGAVLLSRPLRTVDVLIWSERKKLATGAIVVAAVMVLLGWWLSRKLTGSLERLAEYASSIRDGKDAKPPTSRAIEIAAVSEAMEGMRQALAGKAYVEFYTQNLAHEVKAPLSAIRAAAELLGEDMPAADRAKFLANLRNESERVQQVVDRMLRLAALESRMELEEKQEVGLEQLLTDVVETHESEATKKGLRLVLEKGENVSVWGDYFLLHQALTNLVQNAVSFSAHGSAVRLKWEVNPTKVMVKVEDAGAGIPEYALPRLFERFYSLPRPETGRKGTGLGLSFVREIVTLHGGGIRVVNRDSGGVCATVELPLNSPTKG